LIVIQDLHDTLRTLEAEPTALDNPSIVDSSGKESLGGGLSVGLTATLQNARLAFEARGGPGFELCRVSGGNLVAVDTAGDTMASIKPTAYVTVSTQASASATISAPTAEVIQAANAAMWDDVDAVESGITLRGALRLLLSFAAGNTVGLPVTTSFKAVGGTKTRIMGMVDGDGNRTVTSLDAT